MRTRTRAKKIDHYIQEILSDLLVHDSMRSGDLVATVETWLSSGCNSTAAAALFTERQTLHKRPNKIIDLLSGDPRGTSRLAAHHLTTRLALASLDTRN
ncbi:helix-turn-helix domain-containing protein [Paeniglutamicibacter sulfureus]|uniref:DNA-binding PucR family transcriptional regulator n=1 Tax=Paeniglutamicibacter sulfureus TaxID=43666 RepID=A0ABU2BGJ6_9MICC|nr:helix-turn-helix domain-containing protein [Paeniglutamicibacter sulfureus]MDR7357766.1 DNA-binding PucR family transcriptional regulator [Paeniglutamicibacter sulfureus]